MLIFAVILIILVILIIGATLIICTKIMSKGLGQASRALIIDVDLHFAKNLYLRWSVGAHEEK